MNDEVKEAVERIRGEITDLIAEHEVMVGPFDPTIWKLDIKVTDLMIVVAALGQPIYI
jgi:hypothetical protein